MVERASFTRLTGMTFSSYHIEKLLEQHPWGPVFLARGRNEIRYMIRFIETSSSETRSEAAPADRIVFLGRFQQEANLLAALQHPHILPLLDYGVFHAMPYLVYPYSELVSLRTVLSQQGNTDLFAVSHYLEGIAAALEYAHDRAVLHRNLSTKCLYLQPNRRLVIAEFGLLRIIQLSRQGAGAGGDGSDGTQKWQSYDGSSESSAPEQLLGKNVDKYTDIYAMGAVLYRMLTGHAPFEGKTHEEVARQHLYAIQPPLKTWRPGLPVDIDHIITKALSKEPQHRFQRPGDFVRAYQEIIFTMEVDRNS